MSMLIDLTKQAWKTYFSQNKDEMCGLQSLFAENAVVIGTGRHEFYHDLAEFARTLSDDFNDRKGVSFKFNGLTCHELTLTEDISVVYGTLDVCGAKPDNSVSIDIDSRFTFVYQKIDGEWKIVHLHQSMPNIEQMDGEYYAKPLSCQVQQAHAQIRQLEHEADTDGGPQINISIGGTCVKQNEPFEDAFQRADNGLYSSKMAGKCRVCIL